ncbi:MAG: hypothetical protein V1743_00830 [Nanoarchaeota archaeon]
MREAGKIATFITSLLSLWLLYLIYPPYKLIVLALALFWFLVFCIFLNIRQNTKYMKKIFSAYGFSGGELGIIRATMLNGTYNSHKVNIAYEPKSLYPTSLNYLNFSFTIYVYDEIRKLSSNILVVKKKGKLITDYGNNENIKKDLEQFIANKLASFPECEVLITTEGIKASMHKKYLKEEGLLDLFIEMLEYIKLEMGSS